MSSTNGSEPVKPERTPRRAASTSQDPEVLAAEIERTREDLAETLDAIADRVSPKRVAGRTRKKVADAVTSAKESVVEQAGVAKGKAVEAKEKATEAAAGAKEKAAEAAAGAKDRVSGQGGSHAAGGSVPLAPQSAPRGGTVDPATLPPVTAVQADGLDLSTTPTPTPGGPHRTPGSATSAGTSPTTTPAGAPATTFPTAPVTPPGGGPKPELVAGGVLGLVLLLLLRRRRTKRKALGTGAVAALAGAGAEMRSDFEKARRKGRRRR